MESTAEPPPVKPKQTARRTRNFRPWATAASMSPASTAVSPQDPSPAKIISDISSGAASPAHDGSASDAPLQQKPATSKKGGLSMTARIMQAQKQWEAKQDPHKWALSKEGQREPFTDSNPGLGAKSESPAANATNKPKLVQESPVPLPTYAQHVPGPLKRSASNFDSDIDTPAAKRQQAMVKETGSEASTPTGSGALISSTIPRNVDVNGRIMEVIEKTGERLYSEYWIQGEDGQGMILTAGGGGLLPLEYQPLDTNDHPWACPVRDCRKQMSKLGGLRGHVFASHQGMAFNDNKDGTISAVDTYKNPEGGKSRPPVIVSCNPISPNAPPARQTWKATTQQNPPQARPATALASHVPLPYHASPANNASSLDSTASLAKPSAAEEYLLQFLSSKQEEHHRPDIDFMRHLPRQRDLPDIWLRQHNGDNLDKKHFAAALAYLVGEETTGSDRCSLGLVRPSSRLAEKCVKLPENMPKQARACFSKTPTCVSCFYRSHLQRQSNDCNWNPDRRKAGEKPNHTRGSRRMGLSAEEGYNSVGSSTADSGYPIDNSLAETEELSDSEVDSDVPEEQVENRKLTKMEVDDASANEEAAPQPPIAPKRRTRAGARTLRSPSSPHNEGTPRMQEWEYNPQQGRLFDSSGQWAVAWSAPYNTARDAFQIAPHISTHRLRLGPGDRHSWTPDPDTFRDAVVLSGEIDLKVNDEFIGTLTQGSIFKVQPGDSCRIKNCCVVEALLYVHVVGNFMRLTAD